MGGFFGIASRKDCLLDTFFGTDYHSHLGTRRGGLAAYDPEIGLQRKIHSIENAPFRTKFEHVFQEMQGTSAIGCSGTLTNEQVYAMTDCQQLIVRMAEFLLNMEASDLDILAREAIRPALGVGSIQPGSILLAALPAAVLVAALLVLRRRRSR